MTFKLMGALLIAAMGTGTMLAQDAGWRRGRDLGHDYADRRADLRDIQQDKSYIQDGKPNPEDLKIVKALLQQLTAIGGSYHNDSGLFCRPCGEKFSQAVANSVVAAPPPQIRPSTF